MQVLSTITCPSCGHQSMETMPSDACQFFYECKGCGTLLRPKAGDCCVFCSYGDAPCPPIQEARERRATPCCANSAERPASSHGPGHDRHDLQQPDLRRVAQRLP